MIMIKINYFQEVVLARPPPEAELIVCLPWHYQRFSSLCPGQQVESVVGSGRAPMMNVVIFGNVTGRWHLLAYRNVLSDECFPPWLVLSVKVSPSRTGQGRAPCGIFKQGLLSVECLAEREHKPGKFWVVIKAEDTFCFIFHFFCKISLDIMTWRDKTERKSRVYEQKYYKNYFFGGRYVAFPVGVEI